MVVVTGVKLNENGVAEFEEFVRASGKLLLVVLDVKLSPMLVKLKLSFVESVGKRPNPLPLLGTFVEDV